MNVVIAFRDFISSHLTDPANRGAEWVFDNYPREEFGQEPIITVIGGTGSSEPHGLGNSVWLGTQMIQIDVWVRDDIGYNGVYDKDLLITLTDKIELIIRNDWVVLPITLISLTDRTPISFNKDKFLWNATLTYEVQALE